MIDTAIETPIVSVIIPAYNCAKYLPVCLDSIISQTYPAIEVIMIDDGSTDGTGDLCDAFAKENDKIKVIHQKNMGQAEARNKGFELSSGQWICYVDADDAIHPDMISLLVHMVQSSGARMGLCGHIQVQEIPEEFEIIRKPAFEYMEAIEDQFYAEAFDIWCITAKLIDREIIEKNSLEKGRLYEDNAVILNWLDEAGKVAVTQAALYYYRINPESTTKKPFNVKHLDLLWALEQRLDFCIEKGYRHLLGKSLVFFIHNTMYLCKEVKKLNEWKLAKTTKKNSLQVVARCLRYSDNKAGVLLRAAKLWLLY